MAAQLLAEGLFAVDQIKAWWRMWAFPKPSPEHHGELNLAASFPLDCMLPGLNSNQGLLFKKASILLRVNN